jgi:hypothetical protein
LRYCDDLMTIDGASYRTCFWLIALVTALEVGDMALATHMPIFLALKRHVLAFYTKHPYGNDKSLDKMSEWYSFSVTPG